MLDFISISINFWRFNFHDCQKFVDIDLPLRYFKMDRTVEISEAGKS